MKKLLASYLFLLFFIGIYSLQSQTLNVISTGQTTSPGTNWSLSGSTLTVTGTANIRASVIVNALANGNLTVVGNTSTFSVAVSEAITATGNNTLTVGSATNTGTITFNAVTSFAGPVNLYGGSINMDQNMTCTSSGSPILLQSTGAIDIAASRTVQSNSGNITLRSNSGGTVLSNASSIILNNSSSLLSQGGNITLGGNFTGAQGAGLYATSGNAPAILISGGTISAAGGNIKLYGKCNGSYDDGIRLTGTINTTGTGTIELYGEASGGTGSNTYFGGVTFGTANTTVSTENGNLTIEGILTNTNSSSASGLNFYRVAGGNGSLSIQLLSKTGNIQVSGRKAPSAASFGIGQCSQGDVYIGSPKDNSWTATGNIIMSLSSFDLALSTGIIFKTTGALNVEPYDASFNSTLTFPFTNNSSISGVSAFTMGKASNTANITIGAPGISVAGPITLYGGTLSLGANITSTAGGEIALYSDAALEGLSSVRSMTTTGAFRYLPQSTSFSSTVTFPITNLSLVNITELQLGKSGNTAGITIGSSATIAGPITIFGGDITVSQNLTSTLSGADILLQATGAINLVSSKTIQTSAGDVTLSATSAGTATTAQSAIYLNGSSQILSNGGNITLGGGYAGSEGNLYAATNISGIGYAVRMDAATVLNAAGGNINVYGSKVLSYGDGVYLNSVNISTTGSGTIGIYGDAFGGYYNSTTYFGGITFENQASTIQTVNGNLTLKGILTNSQSTNGYGINFYRSTGSTGQTRHIQLLSETGAIEVTGDAGSTIGGGIGFSSWGNVYFGSPADASFTATGDVTISYSKLVGANANGFKVKTTGDVSYLPTGTSFTAAQTFPYNSNYTVADGASSLTIGKASNIANITMNAATTVAGPITAYGGTITLNANLTTTNYGDISLYTDNALGGLSVARTINASGSFNYIPRSDFFSAPVTYPISNLNLTSSGLLIGKSTNTAAITFANATTVAGPITAYGGTITLDANLTTTNNGAISLYTDNALGGLSTARTLTAAGAFKYIPRTTTFSADVTYPIANLTATSTSLTIGNATNDKNITINADVTGGAGIELYGNNVNINSNLTTTGTSAIMHLKGNTTIAAGKTITSGGNFTHDGNLTFKSNVNGTAAFGTLGGTFTTVSGLATTERYVPSKRGWRLLTAPLKGATNNTIPANWQGVNDEGLLFFSPSTYQSQAMTGYTTGGGMPNIWKYDSVNTQWQSIPNLTTENLFTSTGKNGFLVFATGPSNSTNITSGATETTLRPEGQLITGNVTHSLTADKYHLIGNPYASPLHTEAMVQANANTKVFMVDPTIGTVGGYVTYDGSNWTPTPPSGSEKYIQSGQGFFVRSTSNTTFTITESDKVVGNSNTWFDRASSSANTSSSSSVEADKIRVLLYKQVDLQWQLADGILTVNSATGNNDVDATDTEKMSNFNENIGFRNGTSTLAIEYRGLPTIGTIQPMRLTGTTVQPCQLRVKTENYSNSDLQPYVEDTQTGVLTLIPIDGSEVVVHFIGIAATTTAPDSRFRIVYPATLSSDDPTTSLSVGIYPNPVEDKMFTIVLANQDETTQYTLTNLLGQQVQQGKLDTLQNTVSVASLQGGVYVLQVVQSGKTFTTKLIIK